MRIASSKDEGEVNVPVDQYWGDWGLSEDGEMVMLVNSTGDMVLDYVFAQPLGENEILERNPAGTGPLMAPDKTQPMQMQRPAYRAVSTDSIDGMGQDFSASVITIGGLLSGVATFVINMDQSREILGRFGMFGNKEEGQIRVEKPNQLPRRERRDFSYCYNRNTKARSAWQSTIMICS